MADGGPLHDLRRRATTPARQESGQHFFGPRPQCCSCPSCRARRELLRAAQVPGIGDPLEQEAIEIADRVMQAGPVPAAGDSGEGGGEHGGDSGPGEGGGEGGTLAAATSTDVEAPDLRLMPDDRELHEEALPAGRRDHRSGPEPMADGDMPGHGGPRDAAGLRSRLDGSAGRGEALPEGLLDVFEMRFSQRLADVRVHVGGEAADMARALAARAFTYGQDIYFAQGEYRPDTREGQRLLAHELAHTIQQRGADRAPRVQPDDNIRNPPQSTLNVSMLALRFSPVDGRWQAGPRVPQAYAIMLKRLSGEGYRPDMVQGFLDWWPDGRAERLEEVSGALAEDGVGQMESFWARGSIPFKLMIYVRDHAGSSASLQLTASQQRVIMLGRYTDRAWHYLTHYGAAQGIDPLPSWMSQAQYFSMVGSRVALLNAFRTAEDAFAANPSDETRTPLVTALNAITASIRIQTDVVDAVRTDRALIGEVGYLLIWPPPARPGDSDATTLRERILRGRRGTAGPSRAEVNPLAIDPFTRYVRTQPGLARRAVGGDARDATAARRELLQRFVRFFNQVVGGEGDQQLANSPARLATNPPHPARLSAYPSLQPPFFDAAIGTDYQFTMSLLFPSVFDAFQSYSYRFAMFRVRDEDVIGASGAAAGAEAGRPEGRSPAVPPPAAAPSGPREGPEVVAEQTTRLPETSVAATPEGTERVEQPTAAVLRTRLARDARYLRADVETVLNDYRTQFGPPGTSVGLISLSGILRFAGTLVGSFFETLFEPRYAEQFVFRSEGLYFVRAIAYPHLQDEAEVSRPPSVAYLPLFARDPRLMAETRVQAQLSGQQQTLDRRDELRRLLADRSLTGPARERLQREYNDIVHATGDVGTQLSANYWQLDERIRTLRAAILNGVAADSERGRYLLRHDRRAPQLNALIRQRDAVRQIYHVRRRRALPASAERVTATFVSDRGQSINLLLEAVDRTPAGVTGTQTWYVSDVTTPNSGDDEGTGSSKAEAILAALRAILQGGAAYGRGHVSVVVAGVARSIRIEASSDQLLMEALENLATVASIAAIAAAPFTAGQSLYLLIPIGVVGAIPSAYRVAQRIGDETFRWDLQMVMDVVNIVSSVVSVGQVAAGARAVSAAASGATRTAMRAYYLSGALMVTGIGADGMGILLMGAGLMAQIEATSELPEGLRQARIAEIIGNAMMQVGIMVAGAVASRRYQGSIRRGVEQSEGAYGRWMRGLEPETRARIESDPQLRETYGRMRPDIRDLLTSCGSWCVPIEHPPDAAMQQRLQTLVDRVRPTPDDVRYLQAYFHGRRANLDGAIAAIEGHRNIAALRRALSTIITPAEVVLMRFAAHAPVSRGPEAQATINRILATGHTRVAELGQIVDHHHSRGRTGQPTVNLLHNIEMLVTTARPGYDHVMADLARGYGFHTGAEFVIRYISENSLWGSVSRFEITNHLGTRRWDAMIAGTLIQFKSWSVFYVDTFLRQFARDFTETSGNLTGNLRWVFENRIGTRQQVEAAAIQAIRDAHGLTTPRPPYDDPLVVQSMIAEINTGNVFMVY